MGVTDFIAPVGANFGHKICDFSGILLAIVLNCTEVSSCCLNTTTKLHILQMITEAKKTLEVLKTKAKKTFGRKLYKDNS